MPRSSRHESSHRGHKHSSKDARDRSDSEEERNTRERKSREEPPAAAAAGGGGAASASRVSRDPESEKRRGSSLSLLPQQEKDVSGSGNGDYSGDRGKKRKDRPVDPAAAAERCNGGDGQDRLEDRELKGEEPRHSDLEGMAKVKVSAVDSKGWSSRRHEGSGERKEHSGGKDDDSAKRRSDKDYSRRESSIHHKDVKDRERERGSETDREQGSERDRESGTHRGRENLLEKERDRGSEGEKKIQDIRQDGSSEASIRKHGGRAGSLEEEITVRGDVENTGESKKGRLYGFEDSMNANKVISSQQSDPSMTSTFFSTTMVSSQHDLRHILREELNQQMAALREYINQSFSQLLNDISQLLSTASISQLLNTAFAHYFAQMGMPPPAPLPIVPPSRPQDSFSSSSHVPDEDDDHDDPIS